MQAVNSKKKNPRRLRTVGILTASGILLQTLCAMPVSADASGSCGDNAVWTLTGTTLKISGTGAVTSTASISTQSSNVKDVVIENGITSLPNNAFNAYSKLETLKMADSVTSIGKYLCYNCGALKSVRFSDNLTEIPASSFYSCRSMESLTLPSKLTKIGNSAFQNNIALQSLKLPDGVIDVGSYAFYGNNVRTLDLGKSLQTIGAHAFDMSCFEKVTIPPTIVSIENAAIGLYFLTVEFLNGRLVGNSYDGPGKTTIVGAAGSAAETYAKSAGLYFIAEGGSHTHTWGAWKTETAAGCETEGSRVRTCTGCGAQETETIPATGHNFGEWKTDIPVTCETNGSEARVCANCGKKETRFVASTGHKWSDWSVTVQPTVSNDGKKERKCEKCGSVESETIPKLIGYAITFSCSSGGTVSTKDPNPIEAGGNFTIQITPNDGYMVSDIVVDGVSQGAANSYTLNNVSAPHTIYVSFVPIPVVVTKKCVQINIVPQKAVWYSHETEFSQKDFVISAVISDNGNLTTVDISNACRANGSPLSLTADRKYGIKTVTFQYTGNDQAVSEYVQANPIQAGIPIYMLGDVDQNGNIEASDANFALNVYLDFILQTHETPVTDTQYMLADVDGIDGVTAKDAMYILEFFVEAVNGNQPSWSKIIPS